MPKIFISYRRKDSSAYAGRLYDSLARAFGKKNVFKDVIDIGPGTDFRGAIGEAVNGCDIALVLIGPQWLTIKDEAGNRRLDDPNDYVRFEIESALRRDRCKVIPILVGSASMPQSTDLPESLRQLAFKNAVVLREDPDYPSDVDKLIQSIGGRSVLSPVILAVAAIAVVIILGLLILPRIQRAFTGDETTSTAISAPPSALPIGLTSNTPQKSTSMPTQSVSVQPTDNPIPSVNPGNSVQASITRSQNAFVLALTGTGAMVTLDNVKFDIVGKSTVDFSRFAEALGLNLKSVKTPLCIRLLRQGQSAAYPQECQSLQASQRISVEIGDSDVFWYDAENSRVHTLNVQTSAAEPVTCTPQQATCPINVPIIVQ